MILTNWTSTVMLLVITFSYTISVAKCDLYSSIQGMKQLVASRAQLLDDLKGYLDRQEKRLIQLKSRLTIFHEEHKKAEIDVPEYIGNPINSYTLIKRLSHDLNKIQNDLNEIVEEKRNTSFIHKDLLYPTQKDLKGVAESLVRIQAMYNIDLTDFVEGKFVDNRFRALSTSDCYVIAKALYEIEAWEPAQEWMQQALRKHSTGDNRTSFTRADIIDFIQFAHYQTGDVESAARWLRQLLHGETEEAAQQQARPLLAHYERVLAAMGARRHHRQGKWTGIVMECSEKATVWSESHSTLRGSKRIDFRKGDGMLHMYLDNNYSDLCRGELVLPPSVSKNLVCRWQRARHPFLLLAPFKLEQLYLDPEVYLVHDAITHQEIHYLQNLTTPILKRSFIIGEDMSGEASSIRVSSVAWISDENAVASRISGRIAELTGLDMATADKLQVSHYVVGGHYSAHNDWFKPESLIDDPFLARLNNRLATVMFYLSDVEAGGATVFPKLGLSVFPERGAALIWRNLHSSLEGNEAIEHAACPVLLGSKWVANKWIHAAGQELVAPCTPPYRRSDYEPHLPSAVPKTALYR